LPPSLKKCTYLFYIQILNIFLVTTNISKFT
jgi:hypothetical protein